MIKNTRLNALQIEILNRACQVQLEVLQELKMELSEIVDECIAEGSPEVDEIYVAEVIETHSARIERLMEEPDYIAEIPAEQRELLTMLLRGHFHEWGSDPIITEVINKFQVIEQANKFLNMN